MGTTIRPHEIEIPEYNPFENDLLDRKESVEVLSRLVSEIEGPSVLAVDSAWGNGKSTFVRIWAQHMRNKGFPIVEFNAWETDYSRDPFVALSSELTEGLASNEPDDAVAKKLERVKIAGKDLLIRSVPAIVRIASAGILDISPSVEQELGQLLASYAEERLAEYVKTKISVEKFKTELQDLANTLSGLNDNRPLVVFIDELDRCRPSYAIELLEIAKHFFSVNRIVFVLAVNRTELAHSIKAFYGSDFDAIGYLRRFIDVDFRLPHPEREKFVNAMLANSGVDAFLKSRKGLSKASLANGRSLLQAFFSVPDLSLRRIGQEIHRLGLVFTMLQKDRYLSYLQVITALILRTINPEMYHSFFRGDASDLDVVERVFDPPELKALRRSDEGVLFETMLTIAACEDEFRKKGWIGRQDQIYSPLLSQYQGWLERPPDESDRKHAQNVLACVERNRHFMDAVRHSEVQGFRVAVERLELLSNELMGERSD